MDMKVGCTVYRTFSAGWATACIIALATPTAAQAQLLGDQWYVGAGGGLSALKPELANSEDDLEPDSEEGSFISLVLGRDFDRLSSGELQLSTMGEASFENGETVDYTDAEASLLYRFFDSRDGSRRKSALGLSVFGRFGVGYLRRESSLDLRNDTPTYFGAGVGLEAYLTNNLALRVEARYLDTDAWISAATIVGRFGGYRSTLISNLPLTRNNTAPSIQDSAPDTATDNVIEAASQNSADSSNESELLPETYSGEIEGVDPDDPSVPIQADSVNSSLPADNELTTTDNLPDVEMMAASDESQDDPSPAETQSASQSTAQDAASLDTGDSDADGIINSSDRCPDSIPGFPVNRAGCGVLTGELFGLEFSADNSQVLEGRAGPLDGFAALLAGYPDARIEIAAYTDNSGTIEEQSQRTRARLRTIGTYLVKRGASIDQLILRSFGSKRSKYDNQTEAGRRANNRIIVFERPR